MIGAQARFAQPAALLGCPAGRYDPVVMKGHHIGVISVPVSDPDRSMAFYIDKLGFELVMDNRFGPGLRWVMLRPPGGETAITLATWFETMPPGSLNGTVLSVTDIEIAAAELRANGALGEDEEIETAPWGRSVTVEDPDGNAWVVQQNSPLPPDFDSTPPGDGRPGE